MKYRTGRHTKFRTKKPVRIAYNWSGYLRSIEGEDPKKWTVDDLRPVIFSSKDYLNLTFEDWNLNQIRKKFFLDLKDAKDWERDKWLPKAMMMMSFVMKREMVPLTELAVWLGMPKTYLTRLTRRDKGFKRLVVYWRVQRIEQKSERSRNSVLTGDSSILEQILPHYHTAFTEGRRDLPYKNPIDVGWRPKEMSKRR